MSYARNPQALAIGALLVLGASAAAWSQDHAAAGHEHHDRAMAMSADEHAAHRSAMNTRRYSVSIEEYDVPDVALIDSTGNQVDLRAILDSERPVALNFIFTTCTTICPVMTATFSQMQRQLGDAADGLRVVSISIDPEYDRPDALKAYAEQFHAGSNWTFLTGDSSDIVNVLKSFDTYAGSKMNHQAATFLKRPDETTWIRIEGLASGADLAHQVTVRLLN